jgi:hypothetical protein
MPRSRDLEGSGSATSPNPVLASDDRDITDKPEDKPRCRRKM